MLRDDVLRKIKSLFRLARKAGTEGEAKAAMAAATRLMAEYGVSQADAETSDEKKRAAMEVTCEGYRRDTWYRILGMAIAELTGCALLTGYILGKGKRIVFLGEEGDAQIAALLLQELTATVVRMGGAFLAGRQRRSFCLGFAMAVEKRSRKLEDVAPDIAEGYGLVLASKKEWLEEEIKAREIPSLKQKMRINPDVDGAAFAVGHARGEQVDLGVKNRLAVGS